MSALQGESALGCGVDLTVGAQIEITFESIFFSILVMTWRTDTSRPVVTLLQGEEARTINEIYEVEQHHHLFACHPEGLSVRCIIAAKAVSWKEVGNDLYETTN
jgi:uracil DNA glycosylase